MKFPFWEIQAATSDFSKENLLGEGEFGHVQGRREGGGQGPAPDPQICIRNLNFD